MSAIDELTRDIFQAPELAPSDGRSGIGQDSSVFSYWKRPDGSIVVDQFSSNSTTPNTLRQWRKLNYGDFEYSGRTGNWTPRIDPFRSLLEAGGIVEFEAAQIIELNWHRRPHPVLERAIGLLVGRGSSREKAILTLMPQLETTELETHRCGFCMDRVFNYDRDLRRHEIVMHRDEVRGREITRAVTGAVTENTDGKTSAMEPLLRMLAEAAVQNASIMPALQKLLEQKAKGSPPST